MIRWEERCRGEDMGGRGEIRSAFRKKAREHHPDGAKDQVKGAEKLMGGNEAEEV
jgi:curved DNA-binding protein CbpA